MPKNPYTVQRDALCCAMVKFMDETGRVLNAMDDALIAAQNALIGYYNSLNDDRTDAEHAEVGRILDLVREAIRTSGTLERQRII